MSFKILFIGDVVGKIGRRAFAKIIPEIKKEHSPDLILANAENATHGTGLTEKNYQELKAYGVDLMTLGDHAFDRNETSALLDKEKNSLLRPANYPPGLPGKGYAILEQGSKKILVATVLGRVFMKMDYDCPFRTLDAILQTYKNEKFSAILVDFHAEATSEKKAFGWHFDGRVSAIFGTHTHVPTCDGVILPQGTAYISDAGMVGARDSVIGVNPQAVISTFLTQIKNPREPVEEGVCIFNSVLVHIDPRTGKAKKIERVDKEIMI